MFDFSDFQSPQNADAQHPSGDVAGAGRLASCGILVAEADDAQRKLLHRFLEAEGARVTTVTSGAEAIAYLFGREARDEDTDIVLLNANLPEVCEIEAVHRLRDGGFTRTIIAMAWSGAGGDRKAFADAGYTDLIRKPINRDELITKLEIYFKRPSTSEKTD